MRWILLILVLLIVVGCSGQKETLPIDQADDLEDSETQDVSDQSETPAKTQQRTSTNLDCNTLLKDSDMQGACPDVAAEEFSVTPLENENGERYGCFFAKGPSDVSVEVSIPEAGVNQAVENLIVSANTWTRKDPIRYDINGITGYYTEKPRISLFFGKGDYLVVMTAGIPEVELCSPSGLQKMGGIIANGLR